MAWQCKKTTTENNPYIPVVRNCYYIAKAPPKTLERNLLPTQGNRWQDINNTKINCDTQIFLSTSDQGYKHVDSLDLERRGSLYDIAFLKI
jgi:hypothetical protein